MSGLLALLCALSAPLPAQTVIYRCSGADGSLALQSMPCPKGSTQQVRTLSDDYQPPVASSAPVPADPLPTRPADTPASVPAAAVTPAPARAATPLPVLHHCTPRRGEAYYTDRLEDTVRCLPMRVTGLDGNPATGAGQACEVQRDRCEPVAQAQVCSGWHTYLAQSRQRWDNAPSRSSSETDTTSAQIAALLAASDCAGPP